MSFRPEKFLRRLLPFTEVFKSRLFLLNWQMLSEAGRAAATEEVVEPLRSPEADRAWASEALFGCPERSHRQNIKLPPYEKLF